MFGRSGTDDYIIAVQAADTMARTMKQDVAILTGFRVVLLTNNHEPPLEVFRFVDYQGERLWTQ
jgi:hypothetical protein